MTTPRATIEIEYTDGSLKVIAKDTHVTERMNSIMENILNSKKSMRSTIANIHLGYCNDWHAAILCSAKFNSLLNP